MAGVVLENVSREYPGGVVAVGGVNLEVRDRELLVLVGPSGCGKTTLLRLVAGLEEPSSGTITIGTRVLNDVAAKDRDIAMVFQNYALYPHMNVRRNLAFGLELREKTNGWGWLWRWALSPGRRAKLAARRDSIDRRVGQAARGLGIEDLLDRFPRQLSGGERQRVALGRAMVRSPAVFLFDEPLSNLDAKLRVETRRELKGLHERLQTTMIHVTHDQVEALTLGQRVAVMNEGRIQQVGRPMDVYDWPAARWRRPQWRAGRPCWECGPRMCGSKRRPGGRARLKRSCGG
jgi:multiple sugar transport system ATP-binding protein